ncbi:MAG: FtsX-like permease family protein, partial [Oscillospiraceae bacterium]
QKIASSERDIEIGQQEIETQKKKIIDAKALFETNQKDMAENSKSLEKAKAELVAGEEQYNAMIVQVEKTKAEVKSLSDYIEANKGTMTQDEYLQYSVMVATAKGSMQFAEKQLPSVKANLEAGKKKVADGEAMRVSGAAAMEQAKITLANGDQDILDAEKKIEDGKLELERGKEEYELAKGDVVAEIDDAEKKLVNSEEEIKNTEKPTWYVLNRESIPAFTSFKGDADGIGAIGAVFPVIFFLVAALVSLTTMTRMVEEERTQIGTFKALGYSKTAIASKYVLYALLASLIGSVIGVLVGESFLPALVVKTYTMGYPHLQYNAINLHLGYAILATVLAVVCTTGATYIACHRALRSSPAELMRPETPKAGKRIMLENVDWIWLRLNFAQKAACRNLFRYKKRLFMTVLGVGGCMALLLVGFGIKDSVGAMTSNQFEKVWSYQGTAGVDTNMSRAEKRQMLSALNETVGVSEYLQSHREMTFSESPSGEQNAYITVPKDAAKFSEYVNLKSRVAKKAYTLDDSGVIITEKLADMLKVKIGDKITVRAGETDTPSEELVVNGIVENYIYHYIYMTPKVYKNIFSKEANLNSILLKTNAEDETELTDTLSNIEGINSLSMNSAAQKEVDKTMNNLLVIVFVMILSAGVLAFIVLYNLNNINITERKRELATLKVLGFYNNELAAYVYRENIILTVIGTIVGIGLGIVLHFFVMHSVETDMIMFGREIHILSYVLSILLTVVFSVLVNLTMLIKLKKIDMVESLKSVE